MADIRQTSQLTDFVGADEDPLSDGGNWASAGVSAGGQMARKSNSAVNSIIGGATLGHSYWTPDAFSDSAIIECWGVSAGGGGGAGGEGWRLGMFTSPGNGYTALYFSAGSPVVSIRKYVGGAFTTLAGPSGVLYNAGIFLLRKQGSTLSFWNSQDGGTTWDMSISTSNGDYTGNFNLVMGAEDQGLGQICGWITFGGGEVTNRTQIYRILRGFDQT